ncbi:MAG: SMODS domain-containing nucleotidyltransferase [Paracoccus hibiscisoli]|uniref:SMODS domain-containing nucleotidyltransferase n=1 Tax=Paracoccus hibiscisoli TaxID=2023261 RepID=UPI00391A4FE3
MKHASYFDDFLKNVVNISQEKLDSLDKSINAVQGLIESSNYGTRVRFFARQGSLAHGTIIDPVKNKEFDADIIIAVEERDDWEPKNYLLDLRRVFWDDKRYADKASLSDVCVTLSYSNDKKIDILPLLNVEEQGGDYHICHHRHNEFIRSEPIAFTQWLIGKNKISGGNSFRKVTRLIKYLRDHKRTFSCPSVLLTTLIGDRITDNDRGGNNFQNVPDALRAILNRLDLYLSQHASAPHVENPSLEGENLSELWDDDKFQNFKSKIATYTKWVNDAYDEEDHNESIKKWRKVFGDKFAQGKEKADKAEALRAIRDVAPIALAEDAAHPDSFVDRVIAAGIRFLQPAFYSPPHLRTATWLTAHEGAICEIGATIHANKGSHALKVITNGEPLMKDKWVRFTARVRTRS